MKYEKIVEAKFIERENRFVARAGIGEGDDAESVKVHVKNTGRCRELLVPGSTVYLEDFEGRMGSRRMRYSLVAVEKKVGAPEGKLLINMDSQAPNKVVHEALADGRIRLSGLSDASGSGSNLTLIKPEVKYGDSRFDFYVEAGESIEQGKSKSLEPERALEPKRAFIEVKGVTLEEDGHARFPDAPTERGIKHINELIRARREGYLAYIIFVVQMKGMKDVSPNYDTHPEFGDALAKAAEAGVSILAYDCKVTPDSLAIDRQIEFKL
ncbi:MAG: DNA/RNA nuclease SfsA [Firmicutes bacterium]|nr:DNA/RNA nuclease SfsA [Bacillota bacterium]